MTTHLSAFMRRSCQIESPVGVRSEGCAFAKQHNIADL